MRKTIGIFLLMLIVADLAIQAEDTVYLKEGKVLTGTIMDEDAKEVTLNLGANMVLCVEKSKIAKIEREKLQKNIIPPPQPVVCWLWKTNDAGFFHPGCSSRGGQGGLVPRTR